MGAELGADMGAELGAEAGLDAAAADAGAEATTAPSMGVWLMPLRQAMRTALLAELDTRLQPVLGLLEAFHTYTPQEQ